MPDAPTKADFMAAGALSWSVPSRHWPDVGIASSVGPSRYSGYQRFALRTLQGSPPTSRSARSQGSTA